jgi:hypothetical protein
MTKVVDAFRNFAKAPKKKKKKKGYDEKFNSCFISLRFSFHLCTTANSPLKPQRTNLTAIISATVFRDGPNPSSDTLFGPSGIMITLNKHVINNWIASQHLSLQYRPKIRVTPSPGSNDVVRSTASIPAIKDHPVYYLLLMHILRAGLYIPYIQGC